MLSSSVYMYIYYYYYLSMLNFSNINLALLSSRNIQSMTAAICMTRSTPEMMTRAKHAHLREAIENPEKIAKYNDNEHH